MRAEDVTTASMPEVLLDLDSDACQEVMGRWGGGAICRIIVEENGKRGFVYLRARVSGDERGGSTKGVHLELGAPLARRVNRLGAAEKSVRLHFVPWQPIEDDAAAAAVAVDAP